MAYFRVGGGGSSGGSGQVKGPSVLRTDMSYSQGEYAWNCTCHAKTTIGPMAGDGNLTFISWQWSDQQDHDSTGSSHAYVRNTITGQQVETEYIMNAPAGSQEINRSISYSDGDYLVVEIQHFNHFGIGNASITYDFTQ